MASAADSVNVCGTKRSHWKCLRFDDLVDFAVTELVKVAVVAAAAEAVKDEAFEKNRK